MSWHFPHPSPDCQLIIPWFRQFSIQIYAITVDVVLYSGMDNALLTFKINLFPLILYCTGQVKLATMWIYLWEKAKGKITRFDMSRTGIIMYDLHTGSPSGCLSGPSMYIIYPEWNILYYRGGLNTAESVDHTKLQQSLCPLCAWRRSCLNHKALSFITTNK